MAFTGRTATSMTDEVLKRVRDPNGVMHTAAFVRDRLTEAQRFLNGILGISINAANLTLNPHQNIYVVSTNLPNCIRVVDMRGSNNTRSVAQVPSIESLLMFGPRWARQAGNHVICWTQVGRDLLVIYPAVRVSTAFPVWYVELTAAFSSGATVSAFSVEQCGLIVTLTEAVLLLRQRDIEASARAMERLRVAMTPELAAVDRVSLAPTQMQPQQAPPNE